MSWIVPSALGIAAAAIVSTIAVHFIARSRPVAEPLPTARFIPTRAVQARTRSFALSDLALLLLRVAVLAAIGAAVAGPTFPSGGRIARVFVVDRSRAVASVDEARDSVRRLAASADFVVAFDSSAARENVQALDTIRPSLAHGSLSAGLSGGIRAAVLAGAKADSVELVLVSPLAREEIDDATLRIRATWPGRLRIVPIRGATFSAPESSIDIGTNGQDVIAAGLALTTRVSRSASVRLIRDRASAADSAWARGRGHVLLHWPTTDSSARWTPRQTIDAIGAVATNAVLVGRFPRLWVLTGQPIARWADGEPAVVEHATGDGCIRDVGVLIDDASDITLTSAFREFARPLLAPCGGMRDLTSINSASRALLAGAGSLAPAVAIRDESQESSRWSAWLFALAGALLIAELALRRAVRSPA